MGTTRISLSILVLVLSVLWKPAYSDKCSIGCKGSPTGQTFLSGHKYNYGVEGTVSIYLTGADKQETGVKLLGQATVTSVGNCVNELVVQNLAISGPDGKKYPCPEGIEKPVRFTIQDGKVGAEICSEEEDSRRSLNIKRAIISLLQTETKPSVETDIFGVCPTEAFSSQEGNSLLVHRNRDLSRCAFREQGKNDLITSVVNPSAEIKNSQVLQSTLNVESKVNSGVPEKVAATEEYLYKPFSVGQNGARAKVYTKLTLTGKGNGAPTGQCTRQRSIIFENPHGAAVDSNANNALAAIKDTAKTLTTEASSKSAGLFAQVVRILRYTNKDDLLKVFQQVKGNNLEKRVFLDGLLRAGTGYSVEASINLLNQLTPLEKNLVFLSLGNARHVNHESIKAAATLLDQPHLPKEVFLGVGALGGAYCRDHNCHKDKPEGIVALSNKLAAKLQNCKPKTKVDEDTIVAALKGIRNIRHLEDNLIEKLVRCANDNGVKARVRVAALEAFHADPCSSKLKNAALALMANRDLDSEIRIQAYLAVIACPCAGSASKISDLLQSEPINQVGRFISSSLRAIRNSANPDRHLAKQHYGKIGSKQFPVDDRYYSYFNELSYNVDALGAGGTLEETVIYSQDSFLPRSASLNVTTELFGHNFNVLEIGGRQGNLDRVIEHFLGPKGLLRTQDPQTLYDNLKKRYEESAKKVDQSLGRGRRSIKTEVDNFDKHLKAESVPYNNELDLDLYVKLFGTDAVFLSLGDDKGFDFNKVLDELMRQISGGLNQIKNFKQEIRAHVLFLDAELAYPTSTGLPLKLDLTGAATARVEAATNIDVRQIIRSPANAKVDIKLVPSTDIELAGLFLVDGNSVATGLKVIHNLHSSVGGHLIAKVLENGNGIDIQFGLPIDKQEILTASNDLVFFTAEKGQKERHVPIKLDNVKPQYSGCFDQLAGVVGLTLCGELQLPFAVSGEQSQASISKFLARYPLSGPSSVKLILEKNDLRGYHIKGILRTDHPDRKGIELLFEAEGSKNRRTQLNGEIVLNDQEKSIRLDFDSPIKVIHTQAAVYNKPTELSLLLKADYDDKKYFAKAGFLVQGNEERSVLKPYLEYLLGGGDKGPTKVSMNGEIERVKNGPKTVYNIKGLQLKSEGMNEVIDLNGQVALTNAPARLEMDLKAKQGQHNVLLRGNVASDTLNIEFQNTLNNNINFKLDGHFSNAAGNLNNQIELVYGPDFKSQVNRIAFHELLKSYEKSADDYSMVTKNKLEIGALNFKVRADAEVDPKKLDIELEGQYQDKKGDFSVITRKHIKNPQDYSFKLNTNFDKQGLEIFSKRDCLSDDKSNFENYVQIKNVAKYELSGVVLHRDKQGDINKGAVGHFKITGKGKTEDIKFDVGVTAKGDQYSSHAKLSSSAGEFLDYLLKISHGANANGQLKLVIKDTISANGQYKVNDADGKGNGMIIFDFKKSQRKIKGDVAFVAKDPVFSAEVDLFLNFEKDNADKLHLSTNNKRTDKLLDSKNKIAYGGKKSELNIHTDGVIGVTGKTHAVVEVVLPTERCLTLKVNREIAEKDEVYNGNAELLLSDAPKRGAQASSIHYKGKMSNTNFDKFTVNYDGQVDLQLKDGRKLQNAFSLVTGPNGDKYKYDFKTEVTGNLLPKKASLTASGTFPDDDKLLTNAEVYNVKGSYGDDLGFDLSGNYDVALFENEERKYQDYFTCNLRLPFEKAHDIKYVSDVLFLNKKDNHEFTVLQSLQVNADLYKVDLKGSGNLNAGNAKLHLLIPHSDPFNLDTNYKQGHDGDTRSVNLNVKSQYGKGKTAEINVDAKSSPRQFLTEIKAKAPQAEKVKDLGLGIATQVVNPDTYAVDIMGSVNDKSYTVHSTVGVSKANPVLDIQLKNPDGTKERLHVKGTTLSSSSGKVELNLENVQGLTLDAVVEGTLQKDNINLKMTGNSEKLGLKNCKVDISSKDAGNGKRLEFHATNDNKNVLSGSTSLISKKDEKQTIYEGSGSVKVREEQKSANFKYLRSIVNEGNEQGIETFLNLALGDSRYVAESKVTNMEFKNSYTYCEEKKECAHIEINSKLNLAKQGAVQHLTVINVDLRKLGVTPEFGLEIKNEVEDKKLPQYTLDVHVNNKEKKYHLHVYSQPEHGKFPAGVTVALPTRTLAAETLLSYPSDKAMPFPIVGELSFHADKKGAPKVKTAVRFLVDVTGGKESHGAVAELGFSHPALGEEALLAIRGKLLTPKEKALKIEANTVLHLPSLGANRECKLLLEASPSNFKFVLDTPLVQIIDVEALASVTEKQQQAEVKFCLLSGKPVTMRALARDYQYYEFTTEEADRKLMIVGHIDPEKRVDVSADIVLGGEKKKIVGGALFLEDNLVKSQYDFKKENFQYFANALKNDLTNLEKRIKELGQKASNDFKDSLKKVEPKLKELEKAYEADLKKIYTELDQDKELAEILRVFAVLADSLVHCIEEVVKATKPIVDQVTKTISEGCKQIGDLYEKQIEPQLVKLYETVGAIIKEYFEGLVDLVAHFGALIADFFEKHKAELEELTNTLAEIFKDLTRLVVAQLKELRVKAGEAFKELVQAIKDCPLVGFLEEKYKELAVPEQVLNVLLEFHNMVRALLPSEETRNFADALYSYVDKKLRQTKIDDSAELRIVYEKFVIALTSLLQLVRQQLNQLGVPQFIALDSLPFSGPGQVSYPGLRGAVSVSVMNMLSTGDIINPLALLQAYRLRSFDILDEVPRKLRGVVVNGQHIFTFDGRHLTFPGHCRYVLAHDHVDRNFTLMIQLQNGLPKALILEDKSGTTIELKDNGQVAVNGNAHGFPVMEKDVFAFRKPDGRIGLGSLYGLMTYCSSKLEVCYVEISGFYLGKLRGLLGDGNNEPYDDFRLPNGKICTSEAEFGNAYRLASSCKQVTVPEHSHHQHHQPLPEACEQVFGAGSPLRPLSLFLDIAPFRQACIHAVAGDAQNALKEACQLGAGYSVLALTGLLPAVLPPVCVKCHDAGGVKEVGDTYSLKLPNKQADILVIFETTKVSEKPYKELLVPLVSQLVDVLKSKRITDIKVHLIGATKKFPYPIVYDTDLKLKNAKVQFDDDSRYEELKGVVTGCEKFDNFQGEVLELINGLRILVGASNVRIAQERAFDVPLRPGAVKHAISLSGERCLAEYGSLLSGLLISSVAEQMALSPSYITVTEKLSAEGKAPEQIVGFTKDGVLLLGEKKLVKGVKVTHPRDICIDFFQVANGLVLSSTNYEAMNPGQQKQYLQLAANSIASQMLGQAVTEDCLCTYSDPFSARSICTIKDRKEVPAGRRRK